MKIKISIAIFLAFAISFSLMVLVVNSSSSEHTNLQEEFYSKDFSKNYTVFIIGSSQVGSINATYVNQIVKDIKNDVIVYNLAVVGDKPEIRMHTLEKILSVKPDLIFYGISSRDFGYPVIEDSILPEPKLLVNKILEDKNSDFFLQNPKIKTLEVIKSVLSKIGIFSNNAELTDFNENTPFFKYSEELAETNILNDLGGESTIPQKWNSEFSSNRDWQQFTKIIESTQQKKIKLVLFTTPQSKLFFDTLSQEQEESFELILQELKNRYNIKIYDLTHKYEYMNIWNDLTHVAFNRDGIIFSDDISRFILNEIE